MGGVGADCVAGCIRTALEKQAGVALKRLNEYRFSVALFGVGVNGHGTGTGLFETGCRTARSSSVLVNAALGDVLANLGCDSRLTERDLSFLRRSEVVSVMACDFDSRLQHILFNVPHVCYVQIPGAHVRSVNRCQ